MHTHHTPPFPFCLQQMACMCVYSHRMVCQRWSIYTYPKTYSHTFLASILFVSPFVQSGRLTRLALQVEKNIPWCRKQGENRGEFPLWQGQNPFLSPHSPPIQHGPNINTQSLKTCQTQHTHSIIITVVKFVLWDDSTV